MEAIDQRRKRSARVEPSAEWVRAPEAKARIINAAIELLSTKPFADVSIRKIALAAELPVSSVQRNFGTMDSLFGEVANELSRRFSKRAAEGSSLGLMQDPDIVLRTRLVAWMITSGSQLESVRVDATQVAYQKLLERQQIDGLSSRTNTAFMEILLLMAQGFVVFGEVHPNLSSQVVEDGFALLGTF